MLMQRTIVPYTEKVLFISVANSPTVAVYKEEIRIITLHYPHSENGKVSFCLDCTKFTLIMLGAELCFFALFVLLISSGTGQSDLHPAMQNLGADWPVPSVLKDDMSSTFGPRILVSGNRYDFHRGVDISAAEGTPIVAALDGTLYATPTYSGGGQTVVLDHDVNILFHGSVRTLMSTYYMHMSAYEPAIAVAPKGTPVQKGTVIGYVGMTGSAVSPHLHFEARLGSHCSLSYQLDNPSSGCASFGHDPHVHPLGLYSSPPTPADELQLSVISIVTSSQEGVVLLTTPDAWPVVNRYELKLNKGGNSISTLAVLDLSLREGFDASSTTALDTQDTTKPYLDPISFGKSATSWNGYYKIPAGFSSKAKGETMSLEVTTVFDQTFSVEVAVKSDSW